MHRLLKRQLKNLKIDIEKTDPDFKAVVEAVEQAYLQFENDKNLLERSMQLSSDELFKSNEDLRTNLGEIGILNKELKETQAKLLKSESIMQMQKMESIGQLAGGVAHDFNNLLGGIIGYGELLRSKLTDDEKLYNYSHMILKSAKRGSNLTQRLLGFSRQEIYKKQTVKLADIINETVEMLKRSIGQEIKIVKKFTDKDLSILGDPTQITQIIMNLCINARDAMDDRGQVTLDFEVCPSNLKLDNLAGESKKKEKYICLSVSDTGTGIAPEDLKKIFEPFFTTKEIGKGTGLGLAMIHGIMNSHDGFIDVESTLGKGTSFKLYFPHPDPSITAEERSMDIEINAYKKSEITGKILVVDDEEVLRELCTDLLNNVNIESIVAADGEQAITAFEENLEDIQGIIMDIMMPNLNGIEAYQKIIEKRANIPFIFVSGYHEIQNAKEIMKKDNIRFLEKPCNSQVLLETIEELFTQK